MSKTVSLPAFIECRDDDGRSVFYPVETVCVRPDLRECAVDRRQLRRVLASVRVNGLWPKLAKQAAERSLR